MGAHLSPYAMKPVLDCTCEEGYGPGFRYGASSMQGWRKSQEDTFKCDVQNYGSSFQYFGVFDGHGGAEVARYLQDRLHNDVRDILEAEQDPELALQLGFLNCDTSIKDPEGLKILNTMVEKENFMNSPYPGGANMEKTKQMFLSSIKRAGWPCGKNNLDGPGGSGDFEPGCSSSSGRNRCKTKILDHGEEEDDSDFDSDYLDKENNVDKEKNNIAKENAVSKNDECNKEDLNKNNEECSKEDLDKKDVSEKDIDKDNDVKKGVTNEVDKEITNNKENANEEVDKSAVTNNTDEKDSNVKCNNETHEDTESMSIDEPVAGSSSGMNESAQNHTNEENCRMDTLHYLLNDDLAPESSDPEDEDFDIDEELSGSESEEEDTFEDMENLEPGVHSGSTGTVLLIGPKYYYCANVGDSRMVLCKGGKAVDMSIDHKPEDPEELKRILATGSKVSDGRINRSLNLSRAFGDFYYKDAALESFEQCVTVEPTINTFPIEEDDEFIVIASDGIWNSMSSQEVVDYVRFRLKETDNLTSIEEELFKLIVAPNTHGDGTGCDNMTCILIQLNLKELKNQEFTSEASNSKQTS